MYLSTKMGQRPYGPQLMKFTLTFDGELASNGRPADKWKIRKHFHPQLQELWEINPALRRLKRLGRIPARGGFMSLEAHHSIDEERDPHIKPIEGPTIDLVENIERQGIQFFPLVRNSLALKCSLRILFMRKENPGKVYQGGDLDNRLKTLFDSLAIPSKEQVIDDSTIDGQIFCLLEDDSLIMRVDVDTQRLLTRPDTSAHEVRLIIEVDVRVTHARTYNQIFLGD